MWKPALGIVGLIGLTAYLGVRIRRFWTRLGRDIDEHYGKKPGI